MACNLFAVSDEASLAVGKQSACGTPQTSLVALRYLSESLGFNTESTESQEIRSDRNVTDLIRTSASVGGDIGFELSYSTYNQFWQGLLQSATPLDGAGTAIKNGKAKSYFTLERNTPTPDGTNYYTSFADMQIGQLDLEITQGSPVTGTWTMLGAALPVTSATSLDTGGYTAANTNPVYNTVEGVGEILVDGVAVAAVQSISLSITNNLREQRALGSVVAAGVASGKFAVTGNMSINFNGNSFLSKFIADQTFSLRITLEDSMGTTAGNKYVIEMQKLKFSTLNNPVEGVGQDILLTGDFQAIYNSAQDGTITVAAIDAV